MKEERRNEREKKIWVVEAKISLITILERVGKKNEAMG